MDSQTRTVEKNFQAFQRTGSPRALGRVIDLVAPELLLLAGRLAPDASAAEDLVQETFVRAIEAVDTFDPEKRVMPWLVAILMNMARRESMVRRRSPDSTRLPRVNPSNPQLESEANELRAELDRAFAQLSEAEQEVLALYLLHGLGVRQISASLDRPINTVKAQRMRGLEKLRRSLPKGLALSTILAVCAGRGMSQLRRTVLLQLGAGSSLGLIWTGLLIGCVVAAAGYVSSRSEIGESEACELTARSAPDEEGSGSGAERIVLPSAVAKPVPAAPTASVVVQATHADTGEPYNGLPVRLVPDHSRAMSHARDGATSAEGECRFEGLPRGAYIVLAATGQSTTTHIDARGRSSVQLSVPRGITLSTGVCETNGDTVPGCEAWICFSGHRLHLWMKVATGDDSGGLTVHNLAPRTLYTVCSSHGHAPTGFGVPFNIGPGKYNVPLVVLRRDSVVRGLVTNPAGDPVAGAQVVLIHLDQLIRPPRATCEALGRFTLNAPAGRAIFWAKAEGFGTFRREITIARDTPTALNVVLPTGITVRGRVTDHLDKPVARVRVSALHTEHEMRGQRDSTPGPDFARPMCIADDDGYYVLSGVTTGATRMMAEHRTRGWIQKSLHVSGEKNVVWNPVLEPGIELRGTVRDTRGRGIEGWQLNLTSDSELRRRAPMRTAKDGSFCFSGCTNLPYTLVGKPRLAGYFRVPDMSWTVFAGGAAAQLVVAEESNPCCGLRARIERPDGTPMQKVKVAIHRDDGVGFERWVETPDGEMNLDSVYPGTHMLTIADNDLGRVSRGAVVVNANERADLDTIAFELPGTLAGSVRVAETLEDVDLTALITETDRFIGHGRVRISGSRILPKPLQPGRYELVAKHPGGVIYAPFEIESGRITRVDTLLYWGPAVGIILPPSKSQSELLRYEIRDANARVRLAQTLRLGGISGFAGYWRFPLPPDDYELRVTNVDSGRSSVARFRVPRDSSGGITEVPFPIPPDKR